MSANSSLVQFLRDEDNQNLHVKMYKKYVQPGLICTEDSVESDLSLDPPTSYTDSKVSLYWILGVDRVWKQFVQRRVTEIRTLLPSSGWQHCPGVENPADLPSRGLSPIELACSELWAEGPKWLGSLVAKDGPQDVPMPEDCAVELRVADRLPAMGLLVTEATPDIDCKRYSSMEKLLRVTARVLMFVNNLKQTRHCV